MKHILLTLLTALTLITSWAGPYEDALSAESKLDYAAVLKISQPHALKGDAWAQKSMGDVYKSGKVVLQDYAEAVRWYKLAAQQGYAPSQSQLGNMYEKGQGVFKKDYAEALKWYKLSAEQGEEWGLVYLARMYSDGNGVARDNLKAHSLYNMAVAKGSRLGSLWRDDLAKIMSPQQINDAQKLARDCQAKQFKGCD